MCYFFNTIHNFVHLVVHEVMVITMNHYQQHPRNSQDIGKHRCWADTQDFANLLLNVNNSSENNMDHYIYDVERISGFKWPAETYFQHLDGARNEIVEFKCDVLYWCLCRVYPL